MVFKMLSCLVEEGAAEVDSASLSGTRRLAVTCSKISRGHWLLNCTADSHLPVDIEMKTAHQYEHPSLLVHP